MIMLDELVGFAKHAVPIVVVLQAPADQLIHSHCLCVLVINAHINVINVNFFGTLNTIVALLVGYLATIPELEPVIGKARVVEEEVAFVAL